MCEVLWWILHRQKFEYRSNKRQRNWEVVPSPNKVENGIAVVFEDDEDVF